MHTPSLELLVYYYVYTCSLGWALGLTGVEAEGRIAKTMTATMHWYPRCPDLRRALGLIAHTDSSLCSRASCQGCSYSGEDQTASTTAPSSTATATGYRSDTSSARPPDVKVAPLPDAVSPGRSAAYRAITWPEYKAVRKKAFTTGRLCPQDGLHRRRH
uniref:Uncharacterized protein n=1 Tax=Oryza meridionalis TaxID=40149 RepID=A0A0E0CXH1_9ORYZ